MNDADADREQLKKIVKVGDGYTVKNQVLQDRLISGGNVYTTEFVSLDAGQEVGLLIFEDRGGPDAHIYEIFVLPCGRGDGVGNNLLSFAESWAVNLGRSGLTLEVRSLDSDAMGDEQLYGWYQRRGFGASALGENWMYKSLF